MATILHATRLKLSKLTILLSLMCFNCKEIKKKEYTFIIPELQRAFKFTLANDSTKYKVRLDTISDNSNQKDIYYSISQTEFPFLGGLTVSYDLLHKESCDSTVWLFYKKMKPLELKSLNKNCKPVVPIEVFLSGYRSILTYCNNTTIVVTCINNRIFELNFHKLAIHNQSDLNRIVRIVKI
jgi:hypothetical protein